MDSPAARTRKAWRMMAGLGCILGATGILLAALLNNGVKSNSTKVEKSVCAIVLYSEDARATLDPRTPHDVVERFDQLITDMRATGIHCPHPKRR